MRSVATFVNIIRCCFQPQVSDLDCILGIIETLFFMADCIAWEVLLEAIMHSYDNHRLSKEIFNLRRGGKKYG